MSLCCTVGYKWETGDNRMSEIWIQW